MRGCTQCVSWHHRAQETCMEEYEPSMVDSLLGVLRTLDEERVAVQGSEWEDGVGWVLTFPILLDDQFLANEFQVFIEAVDNAHELSFASKQFPIMRFYSPLKFVVLIFGSMLLTLCFKFPSSTPHPSLSLKPSNTTVTDPNPPCHRATTTTPPPPPPPCHYHRALVPQNPQVGFGVQVHGYVVKLGWVCGKCCSGFVLEIEGLSAGSMIGAVGFGVRVHGYVVKLGWVCGKCCSGLYGRSGEELERQKAHERYMKLKEQGKTEQARKDLGVPVAKGVSGKFILVEKHPFNSRRGIVLAMAPLAGLFSQRGRWTLGFSNAEACEAACVLISEETSKQRSAIEAFLAPFLYDNYPRNVSDAQDE
ncbi:hypothetical protein Droror1_Dr00020195 [Drosera rotundifolia]